MISFDFPSVTAMRAQSYISGILGRPLSEREVSDWLSRARDAAPRLTERAACTLFVLAHAGRPVSVKELEAALGVRFATLSVVLSGLSGLGFIDGHAGAERSWERFVMLTESGKALCVVCDGSPVPADKTKGRRYG